MGAMRYAYCALHGLGREPLCSGASMQVEPRVQRVAGIRERIREGDDVSETMESRDIEIDGERYSVHAVKTGKATWKAYGAIRDQRVEVSGRTPSEAFGTWKRTALRLSDYP